MHLDVMIGKKCVWADSIFEDFLLLRSLTSSKVGCQHFIKHTSIHSGDDEKKTLAAYKKCIFISCHIKIIFHILFILFCLFTYNRFDIMVAVLTSGLLVLERSLQKLKFHESNHIKANFNPWRKQDYFLTAGPLCPRPRRINWHGIIEKHWSYWCQRWGKSCCNINLPEKCVRPSVYRD